MKCLQAIWHLVTSWLYSLGILNNERTTFLHKSSPGHDALPFQAIWNIHTENCEKYGVFINVTSYNLIVNKNHEFIGDTVTLLYDDKIGYYPKIDKNGTEVNGGIPQNTSFDAHLHKAKNDIQSNIPNVNFEGIGVIDWEAWRPIWERNFDSKKIYQEKSEDLVRKHHPEYNSSEVKIHAKKGFEQSAWQYMNKTLLLSINLRPDGKWGFYGFPNCYNEKTRNHQCTNKVMQENDRLKWLFNTSTALFPSIYLSTSLTTEENHQFVTAQIKEALRLADDKPVFAYSRFIYRDKDVQTYSYDDLLNTIKQSADMGLNGVVLWELGKNVESRDRCSLIKEYVDETLGPLVKNVTNFMETCSREMCSAHGRCILPSVHNNGIVSLMHYTDSDKDLYICKCFKGWYGEHCENRSNL